MWRPQVSPTGSPSHYNRNNLSKVASSLQVWISSLHFEVRVEKLERPSAEGRLQFVQEVVVVTIIA